MRKKKIKDTTRTVLTLVEDRLQDTRKQITEVLMLVEDNLRTSASSSGLRTRKDNLRAMEKKLIELLYTDEEPEGVITKEEAVEEMYWMWVKSNREEAEKVSGSFPEGGLPKPEREPELVDKQKKDRKIRPM